MRPPRLPGFTRTMRCGSTPCKLLYRSPVPVLVVRTPDA